MSTVVRRLGCRFQINSNDHSPPHCHVTGHGGTLKVSLIDFKILECSRFTERDASRLVEVVKEYRFELLEQWQVYHGEKE